MALSAYQTPAGVIKLNGLAFEPIPALGDPERFWVMTTLKNDCSMCGTPYWGRFLLTLPQHYLCCWKCLMACNKEAFKQMPPFSAFKPISKEKPVFAWESLSQAMKHKPPGYIAGKGLAGAVDMHKPSILYGHVPNRPFSWGSKTTSYDTSPLDESKYVPVFANKLQLGGGVYYYWVVSYRPCYTCGGGDPHVPSVMAARIALDGNRVYCLKCAKSKLALKGHPPPGLHDFVLKESAEMPTKKEKVLCYGCQQAICEVCQQCENTACKFVLRKIVNKGDVAAVRHLLAETQKARGYVALSETKIPIPRPFRIIENIEEVDVALKEFSKHTQVFVRPCPTRPRHGFVESRLVDLKAKVTAQFEQVLMESKAADPKAELLVLPYVDAKFNMVITPTRLAVGPGHDGATAGKNSIVVPLMGAPFMEVPDTLYMRAGVDTSKEDPYFEAVVDEKERVFFTQVRAGAKIDAKMGKDYIPKDMLVTEVMEASLDLLEWEKQMKKIKPGTAVFHLGGTLISHYGVHCLYNNVPILTTRVPKVGETLKAKAKMTWPEPRSVMQGLDVGVRIPMSSKGTTKKDGISCVQGLRAMLVSLHNAGAMSGDDGFWLGFGSAIMMRTGMAASHGEARHKDPSSKGFGRQYIYELALGDFFGARQTLGHAQHLFQHASWGGGYGGKKWANCTEAVFDLDTAVRTFLKDPGEKATGKMVSALNNAVNQAHNNGWWMNKFIGKDVFDRACKQSLSEIVLAAPIMHKAAAMKSDILAAVGQWKAEPEIEIKASTGKTIVPALKEGETCPCEFCQEYGPKKGAKYHEGGMDWGGGSPSKNANGTYTFSEKDEIVAAQAQVMPVKGDHNDDEAKEAIIHAQFKIENQEDKEAYFSFDVLADTLGSAILDPKQCKGLTSWANSGKKNYVALFAAKIAGTVWAFTNDDYNIAFKFDLKTWNLEGLPPQKVNEGGQKSPAAMLFGEGAGGGPFDPIMEKILLSKKLGATKKSIDAMFAKDLTTILDELEAKINKKAEEHAEMSTPEQGEADGKTTGKKKGTEEKG